MAKTYKMKRRSVIGGEYPVALYAATHEYDGWDVSVWQTKH